MFKKTTLYIARSDKENKLKESGPCIDCLNLIKQLKIKRIIYTVENGVLISNPEEYIVNHISNGRRHLNKVNK